MAQGLLSAAPPQPLTPARIRAHAESYQFTEEDLDWTAPFDRSAWLLCPTLTPLYHTRCYGGLTEPQRRRYNQLAGLCTLELVGLFERSLQPIFASLLPDPRLPAELRALLPAFIADESRHADIWWKLNRLAEPNWYARAAFGMVRMPWPARALVAGLARHPVRFPVAVWTALALEEHALEIARRTARAAVPVEPRFLAAYRLHARDEARHVQIDRQVLEQLLPELGPALLRLNVSLFRGVVDRFLLRPVHVAATVVRRLAREFPDLRGRVPAMVRELGGLSTSIAYREMIFSPRSSPMTFALIERFGCARRAFEDLRRPAARGRGP